MWEVRNECRTGVVKPDGRDNLGEVSSGRSITLKWTIKENVKRCKQEEFVFLVPGYFNVSPFSS
jgi:hypothetical protein